LTEEGRQQIRQARVLLDFYSLSFTHYWVSDWIRAKESALIFCPDAHFTVDSRLGETDAGAAADMPLADFTRSHQAFWQNFQPARKYPGGESHQDLYERAVAWLRELECSLSTGVSVLAVTHAGPICALLHFVCHVPMRDFPMFLSKNASLTKIEQKNGHWRLSFFSLTAPHSRDS